MDKKQRMEFGLPTLADVLVHGAEYERQNVTSAANDFASTVDDDNSINCDRGYECDGCAEVRGLNCACEESLASSDCPPEQNHDEITSSVGQVVSTNQDDGCESDGYAEGRGVNCDCDSREESLASCDDPPEQNHEEITSSVAQDVSADVDRGCECFACISVRAFQSASDVTKEAYDVCKDYLATCNCHECPERKHEKLD